MSSNPKVTFIGAGSSVFMKNIVGDLLHRPALAGARIALMDINPQRLEESAIIAGKLIQTLGVPATIETFTDQRPALEAADIDIAELFAFDAVAHGFALLRRPRPLKPVCCSPTRPALLAYRIR